MYTKSKGFTLIELLVVVSITAIMAVIALPNMSQWLASRRAANQAEQIVNLLRFARGEAARLNLPVYICPVQIKKDGKANNKCSKNYAGQGLFAFADKNADTVYNDDKKDISVRAIILNANGENQRVTHIFSALTLSGKPSANSSSQVFWAYYPDGTFGHSHALGTKETFSISSGYVKIAITDADAQTEAQKKARASVVLIDPSGRAEICAKTDQRTLCEYSEK